jgi:Bacterial Ig-like domain
LYLHGTVRRITLSVLVGLGLFGCLLVVSHLVRENQRPPVVIAMYPTADEVGVSIHLHLTLIFNKRMLTGSITPATIMLRDDRNQIVPATITYEPSTRTATLSPTTALLSGGTYNVTVLGGPRGTKDSRGHPLETVQAWKFTTGISTAAPPEAGPGGPILLISSQQNGFSQYYAEILRNEGFNEFTVIDLSQLNAAILQKYDVTLLGELPLDEREVHILSEWVHQGGNLIAMRPADNFAATFEEAAKADSTPQQPPFSEGYLAINSKTSAGRGLTKEPIQFHGSADRYRPCKGTSLATLYIDSLTATPFSAVCQMTFGNGNVILFSYDLARSVVYTRQGNPQWANDDRDGLTPVRSDDLFFGASVSDPLPDWVAPDRIAIPQADIQQRLLSNIITLVNSSKKPLPHFWYLPRGLKAVIVMTGDDHGHGGTVGRFRSYFNKSPPNCSVENWECIRGTSNVFVGSIKTSEAALFASQGFEIGLHVYTGCADWPTKTTSNADGTTTKRVDRTFADALYTRQLTAFAEKYPGVPPPVTNRIDCVTWGDYDTQPQLELSHGIRLDTNYYYWPPKWVQNRPGLFTGSGMPMRFARQDGTLIDVYQATTQMTDESKQKYPYTVDTLLSNALGDPEYYAVLTVNMHTDRPDSPGANAIIKSSLARHIPIITAAQMLKWLDGRNASSFQNLAWFDGQLGFTIAVGTGGSGLQALLPTTSGASNLVSLTLDGVEINRETRNIAGLTYSAFSAAPGRFVATYRPAAK